MEIRLSIDDAFMESLKEKLGEQKAQQLTKDALILLNWAATEVQKGRVILSANTNGDEIKQLAMPVLEKLVKA